MTDPIADMIIRLKNGYMAHKKTVEVPHSNLKEAIANILRAEEYVADVVIEDTKPQKTIVLTLRYVGKMPAVTDVLRNSKPGRRFYSTRAKLPRSLGGYGIVIVSTNKGVMTEKDARKQNVGGEVLCTIW